MRGEILKNLLAAIGAVFLIVIALSFVLAYVFGGGLGRGDKIAVVKLEGVITDSADIDRQLHDLEERDDVKGVVIRINSPGGAVGPSQEIYTEIKRLRKTKKVVASMGAIAASGGYYASVAAEKIVANPGTITGSIGVIVEFIDAQDLLAKIGLKGYVVKSGKYKDTGSPLRKMEKDEKDLLQGVINDVNGQFIKAVAEGRHMKIEDVTAIADGRIFSGSQARERGLVDSLGDLTDAINLSAQMAGIKGKPTVVYTERKAFSLWKTVMGDALSRNLDFTELFSGLRIMYLIPKPYNR